MADLFDPSGQQAKQKPQIVATYDYTDEQGVLLFQVVRFEPKDFRQRRPDGNGDWGWKLGDVRRVPYRLPELLEGLGKEATAYIVEGEKDADRLRALGYFATCSPGGAGKWRAEFSQHFQPGDAVSIVADRDPSGRDHARKVHASLQCAGVEARIVETIEGNDVSDHLDSGHAVEDLRYVTDEMLDSVEPGLGNDTTDRLEAGFTVDDLVEIDLCAPALESPERIRLVSSEEFESDPAPKSIVDGLIYDASSHLLTGASKAGKSWLAEQLVICAAHGSRFLDLNVRPTPVLLLSLEMTAGIVRDRMRGLARDVGLPDVRIGDAFRLVAPTLHDVPQLDLTSDSGADAIGELIDRTRAGLVIFDTLYRFLPRVDPNSNADMGEVFGRVNTLAQRTGAALLLLDHVAKGEQLGPVSHSALGASVKGGASRVVIALKRTSKEDGGRWEINVESHFGSWEEPIHYERPLLDDGERGFGCVRCGAAHAWGLNLDTVGELFDRFGERDEQGRPVFPSKKKLTDALIAAKHASGNSDGGKIVSAIFRDYCISKGAARRDKSRPIATGDGPRNAVVFTWMGVES